jgi:hypothetical protein
MILEALRPIILNGFLEDTETGLFPELYGFVVTDPELLDTFHGGSARDCDLLELYVTTDAGDAVSSSGVAIPILGLDPGYYSVIIRANSVRSQLAGPALRSSSGWILQVISGCVVVAGIGHLKRWDPDHPKVRRFSVPSGWYSVTVYLGSCLQGDDFALDIELVPQRSRPPFSADPNSDFSSDGAGAEETPS